VALAASERLNVLAEADKFRDHAQSTGRTLVDWDAGFRNWIRKSAEGKAERKTSEPYSRPLEKVWG
jgi:hypothetical protein